jgi:hypothetical protein
MKMLDLAKKKVLVGFIFQILIKNIKIEKKIPSLALDGHDPTIRGFDGPSDMRKSVSQTAH